jgi:hypothetical protein
MPIEGTPLGSSPDHPDLLCGPQAIIRPPVTRLYGTELPTKRRAIYVQQGLSTALELPLFDTNGNPIDVAECDLEFICRIREVISTRSNDLSEENGSLTIDDTNNVQVTLPATIRNTAGVYHLEVGGFQDDNMIISNRFYLWIDRGLFGSSRHPTAGPPTLDEVRLYIRDNAPEENLLLDDFEFDLAEICQATENGVRYWNESQPPINLCFDTTTYPVRDKWLTYIAGHLFIVAAHRFRRNQLAYQAGGVAVDDQNKFQLYAQTGMTLQQDYKEWVKQKKVQINCEAAITHQGSAYGAIAYRTLNN